MRFESEEFVEEARDFLASCLSHGPYGRFADLLSREALAGDPRVASSLEESADRFAPDLARWSLEIAAPKELFDRLLLAPTLLATWLYRVCRCLFENEVARVPDVLATLSRWMTGTELYYSAEIGPGLKLIHGLGTVVGARCRIGAGFTAYQGVTIGDSLGERTGPDARPVIGDQVIASVGAKVLGPVTIGDRTIIAANAVVLESVPGRCVVAGIPARVRVADLSEERFQRYWDAVGR